MKGKEQQTNKQKKSHLKIIFIKMNNNKAKQ